MDPFSITVGAVGLADVCFRLVKFLKDVPAAVASIQQEIDRLITEVESLKTVVTSVQEAFEDDTPRPAGLPHPKATNLENLWQDCRRSLDACHSIATQLEELVHEVYGKTGPKVTGKFDGLGKELRRRDKAPKVQQLRGDLSTEKCTLNLVLTGISLYNQETSRDTLNQISKDLHSVDQNLKSQKSTLERHIKLSGGDRMEEHEQNMAKLSRIRQLQRSTQSVATAVSVATPNEFFETPQPVSSFYTGRNWFLERLQIILLTQTADEPEHKQLRFVVHGIGGSGKTQFCSKFAEQNRDSFWGVFWIDASSRDHAKQSFASIGKIVKVEPNYNAVMNWLSNREERWLLIIDNADNPRIELHEYFPKGDRGHIIITTRNPSHKIYGNVGPGSFEFHGMNDDDASALLLRTAQLAQPWDADSSSWATKITRKLGSLALALIHAGAAIRTGLCTLKDYLSFYDQDWERIRRTWRPSLDSSDLDEDYMSAHTTYEVSYRGIEGKGTESSEDAIQLLKMLSFFHFKNIRFDILTNAIVNCEIEKVQQEKADLEESNRVSGWYQRYNYLRMSLLKIIMSDRSPPALPRFIREGRELRAVDVPRVRYALKELTQMSLITYHESNDSYSLHPLVHRWARQRPAMSTKEQAVWSQAAASTLAHAILLPPLGDTEADELFRRDILPHIDHVRSCQEALKQSILKNRQRRWPKFLDWPGIGPKFSRAQVVVFAKYSLVYAQNGRWNDAEMLQLAVKEYTDGALGLDHPVARRITLALALTYWNQSRGDEAANLQDTVLKACVASLGPSDHETLMTMDILGQSRWQQGRYSEAKILQREAVDGLKKLRGLKHEDTLSAMGNLGRTLAKFYENLDEAWLLLEQSFNGMKEILGLTHLKTLIVREDLAMLTLQMGKQLSMPSEAMQQVLDSRKEKLGKEHPYTLLAMVNLARVNIALNQLSQAEELVRSGLEIADRNLGEDHIGTLMGRTVLGTILIHESRFDEAEATLLGVIEKQRHISLYRGDFHPDRLGAMIELAWCYREQKRFDESLQLCNETIEGLRTISLTEHPLERKMKEQRRELIELKRAEETDSQCRDQTAKG